MGAQIVPAGGGPPADADAIGGVPIVYVNGKKHALPLGRAECTLLTWLRGTACTSSSRSCGAHFQVYT